MTNQETPAPPAPRAGQIFLDRDGGVLEDQSLDDYAIPPGFYLVDLSYGPSMLISILL